MTTTTPDTRRLFDGVTTRKAVRWSDCNAFAPDEAQREALATLPVVETCRQPSQDFATGDDTPVELVAIYGGARYYVNTEGYRYARYAARIVEGAR